MIPLSSATSPLTRTGRNRQAIGVPGAQQRQRLLRILEPDQPGLRQRIDADDLAAVARRLLQLGQHARVAGARVLADDEDAVGVARSPRSSPSPCRCRSSRSARGRSIRGTCSSSRAGCWCRTAARTAVQERRLVAGAPRGVERRLVGRGQRVAARGDQREGVRPTRSARSGRRPARRTIGWVMRPCWSSQMSLCASSSEMGCCGEELGRDARASSPRWRPPWRRSRRTRPSCVRRRGRARRSSGSRSRPSG